MVSLDWNCNEDTARHHNHRCDNRRARGNGSPATRHQYPYVTLQRNHQCNHGIVPTLRNQHAEEKPSRNENRTRDCRAYIVPDTDVHLFHTLRPAGTVSWWIRTLSRRIPTLQRPAPHHAHHGDNPDDRIHRLEVIK